jgi:NAD(P)-dependent dehydrogenase (short-subunit alcohol dehydrogenase family)
MTTFHESALEGQHVIISGGLGSLGIAIVGGLAAHGARVTVNDILPQADGEQRLAEAVTAAQRTHYLPGDVSEEGEVERLVAAARERFGPITTALCHVGVTHTAPLIEVSQAAWEQTMDVNLTTAFLLAKHSARAMIEDGVSGRLIFTTSWVAETPWPDIGPYNASKAAMQQLMRSFGRELAGKGIRANAIAPGIVAVGMGKRQWDSEPEYRARARRAIPLGYMQPLESVVDGFIFLCSPAADYMTGSVLLVDGGCSLYPMDE